MVEFSIVAFLLLVMVFGMVDYSRYFLIRANLTNAARDGARYGATLTQSSADQTLIQNHTSALIHSNPSGIVPQVSFPTNGTVSRVRVEINAFPFTPATFLVIKQAKTISVHAEFRRELQP